MECPNCGEEPISLGKLMFKMNPFRVTCKYCRKELRANSRLIAFFVVGVILSAALGFGLGYYLGLVVVAETIIGKYLITIAIGLPIIIGFALAMSYGFWKYGGYEVKSVYR